MQVARKMVDASRASMELMEAMQEKPEPEQENIVLPHLPPYVSQYRDMFVGKIKKSKIAE